MPDDFYKTDYFKNLKGDKKWQKNLKIIFIIKLI
jgi:hypothetical protein